MITINLLRSLLLPVLAGYLALAVLFKKEKFPLSLSLALSYGLGLGILSHCMLFIKVFRIPFGLLSISVPLIVFCVALLGLYARPVKRREVAVLGRIEMCDGSGDSCGVYLAIYYALFAFVLYYVFFVLWRAMNLPTYGWDPIATSTFKAKVLFYENGLVPLKVLPNSDYPLHVPFIQAWIAFNLGAWNDQLIKIIFPLVFISYLVVQFNFLKCLTNRIWAMFGVALAVSSSQLVMLATVAYRDFFMLYYNCCAVMLLVLWYRKQNDAFLLLASLFAGIMTFTKLEGYGYLLVHLFLVVFILWINKRIPVLEKVKKTFQFIIPSGAIYLFYVVCKMLESVQGDPKAKLDFSSSLAGRIVPLIETFGRFLFLEGHWNILWFILLISLTTLFFRKLRMEEALIGLALVMFFGLLFCAGLFTASFNALGGSYAFMDLTRLILHFFPLSIWLIVLLNAPERTNPSGQDSS